MRTHCRRLALMPTLALSLLLGACTGQSVAPGEGAPYIQSQKQQARMLRQQGKLAESLAFWRSILPADKNDTETRKAITELENTIGARVRGLEKKAGAAYQTGQTRQGDTYSLKILALQPGNPQAVAWLVASKTQRAQTQASSKTQQEYAVAKPARAEQAPVASSINTETLNALLAAKDYAAVITEAGLASDPVTAGLVRAAYIGQGEQAVTARDPVLALQHFRAATKAQPLRSDPLINRILTIQQEASDALYREGRKVLNSDIDAAIAAFSKAVEIKPDHATAKSALKRTKTLKRNLEKIEKR